MSSLHTLCGLAVTLGFVAGCDNTTLKHRGSDYPPSEPEPVRQYASCGHDPVVAPADVPVEGPGACPATLPKANTPCLEPEFCVSVHDPLDPGWAAECTGNGSSEGIWLIYRGVSQPAGDSACGGLEPYAFDDFRLRFAEGTRQGAFAYEATDADVSLRRRQGRFFYWGDIGSLDDRGSLELTHASLDEASCTLTLGASGQCVGSRGDCAFTGSVAITLVPGTPRTGTFQQACDGTTDGQRSGGIALGYW